MSDKNLPFRCENCDVRFATEGELAQHNKETHSQETQKVS